MKRLIISINFLLIIFHGFSADWYSTYGTSRSWSYTVLKGTSKNMEVDKIVANRITEWYINGDFSGETDKSGLLAVDPDFTYLFSTIGTTTIKAIVYDNSYKVIEEHIWTVTVTPPVPTVTTGSATIITTRSAKLNGSLNPNGGSTSYYFEYGKTTSYGTKTTTATAGSGTSDVTVSANIDYLESGTIYHYRLVATNSGETTPGRDMTFTTTSMTIGMTAPSSNISVVQGNSVSLSWTGSPSSCSVSLLRDNDKVWDSGNESGIANGLSASGSYTWTPPIDTYYVAASITDGYNIKYAYANVTVTVMGNYSISGKLTAGTDPFSHIGGLIVVAKNSSTSATFESTGSSYNDGSYTIPNVPQGTYSLSIKNANSSEFTITGSGSSPFSVSGTNVTGKNLILTSNLVPAVSINTNLPAAFTPGQSFTFRVSLKNNTTKSSNLQSAYIDVSFPENPTVEIINKSAGLTAVVYATDAADAKLREIYLKDGITKLTSFYKLASGSKTGIAGNEEIWMDIKVTPPANATYSSLKIKYRGTIGDKHDPASGSLTDQQGWSVYEKTLTKSASISGKLTAGTDPFSPIGGLIVVAKNSSTSVNFPSIGSSFEDGSYTIPNVPQGTYSLSIKDANSNEFSIAGTGNSPFAVSGTNVTGKNLILTSNLVPAVSINTNLPAAFTPGQSFTFRVTLKNNTTKSSNLQSAYIDVSFPENPTVEIINKSAGSTAVVYATDAADAKLREIYLKDGITKLTSFYKLASGSKTGIAGNEEIWMDIKVTPPANATYSSLKIKYRGTIGDKHDPASGSLTDQQGWSVKEVNIPVKTDAFVKDWTTVNIDGIDYVVQFKANSNYDLANIIINQTEYCNYVDEVSIFSIINGQRLLVDDQSKQFQILTMAANKVLLKNVTNPVRYNSITESEINYTKDVVDKDGNSYRLTSLLDLSNNEGLIRDPLINFTSDEGTDYFDNRYKMYSEVLRSLVYFLDENQIKGFYINEGPILGEIGDALNKVTDFTVFKPLEQIEKIMIRNLKLSSTIQIMNSSNSVLTINTINNLAYKISFITNIIQSLQTISYNRKKALIEYLFMTELTGYRIEVLYEGIMNSSGSLKDKALVAAIKDIRYDFHIKYNAWENGDWKKINEYIAYGQNEADFNSVSSLSILWAKWFIAGLGIYPYLAIAVWDAASSLLKSRDKVRCSIFAVNLHEILYLSIKNKSFNNSNEYENINCYGIANNLMYLSAFIAHNYAADYLNDPLVVVGSWLSGVSDRKSAIEFLKENATTALNFYNNSGAPWYFSGTPDAKFNQTCLAGKLTTKYLETEKISPPILSVTKNLLIKK